MGDTGIPILAQRLIINLRSVDYVGAESVASKIMFAPLPRGKDDDTLYDDGVIDSLEMNGVPTEKSVSTASAVRDENLKV